MIKKGVVLLMKADLKNNLTLLTLMFDFLSQLDEGQLSDLLAGKVSLQLKTPEDDRFEALFREEMKKPEMVALMDERIKALMGGQVVTNAATAAVVDITTAAVNATTTPAPKPKPSKPAEKKPKPNSKPDPKANPKSNHDSNSKKPTPKNSKAKATEPPPPPSTDKPSEKKKAYRRYTDEDREFILNPDTPIEAIMERYGIDKKHSVYGVKAHLRKQLEKEAQGQGDS